MTKKERRTAVLNIKAQIQEITGCSDEYLAKNLLDIKETNPNFDSIELIKKVWKAKGNYGIVCGSHNTQKNMDILVEVLGDSLFNELTNNGVDIFLVFSLIRDC